MAGSSYTTTPRLMPRKMMALLLIVVMVSLVLGVINGNVILLVVKNEEGAKKGQTREKRDPFLLISRLPTLHTYIQLSLHTSR